MKDLGTIALLGSANLFGSALADLCNVIEPALHILIGLSQVAVATVTVWYIVRRTRQLAKESKIQSKK